MKEGQIYPLTLTGAFVKPDTDRVNASSCFCRQMDLVPPPEKITLPAGVNLVQCFVCTAMFYAQEDHDKHIKLHRKADILRAITEHRCVNHGIF